MKKLSAFFAGVFVTILLASLTITALAAGGAVSFNTIALAFNGQIISKQGEDFTLPGGQSVPGSIVYTDENGGGTTYLPVRRVSELLGVDIAWNGKTGAVEITGEERAILPAKLPDPPQNPPTAITSYEDFMSLWELRNDDYINHYQQIRRYYSIYPDDTTLQLLQNTPQEELEAYILILFERDSLKEAKTSSFAFYSSSRHSLFAVDRLVGEELPQARFYLDQVDKW